MRAVIAAALVCLCSCQHPALREQTVPSTEPTSAAEGTDPHPHRIAVGDRTVDAAQRILAAGGEDYSRFVGVLDYPMSSWYILRDGTCLQVTPAALEGPGHDVIGRLTLGEPGKGYGGWEKKRQRRREVENLDLR
jgi:hypothetical protein